jgi:hypothetical protein
LPAVAEPLLTSHARNITRIKSREQFSALLVRNCG